jgi:hypothetical protein
MHAVVLHAGDNADRLPWNVVNVEINDELASMAVKHLVNDCFDSLKRTFSNVMPPRCIERVGSTPTSNAWPICFASGVFKRESRPICYLGIQRRVCRDITGPPL